MATEDKKKPTKAKSSRPKVKLSDDATKAKSSIIPKVKLSDDVVKVNPARKQNASKKNINIKNPLAEDAPQIQDLPFVKKRLRILFLIALVLGIVSIFLFKDVGFTSTIPPVLIMLIYCYSCSSMLVTGNVRIVFADSMYYLGFLFTFVALLFALNNISADSVTSEIVGTMGPALATTILGMAARILITHFETITAEPETDIYIGMNELAINITKVAKDVQTINVKQEKSLLEFYKTHAQQLVMFQQKVDEIDFSPLTKQLEKLNNSLQKTEQGIDNQENSLSNLNVQTNNLTSASADLENKIRNIDDFDTTIQQLHHVSHQSNTHLQQASAMIDQNINNLDAEVKKVGKFSEKYIVEAANDFKQASQVAQKLRDDVEKFIIKFINDLSKMKK